LLLKFRVVAKFWCYISLRVFRRLKGLKRSRWNWFEIQALWSEVGCLNRGRRLSVSVSASPILHNSSPLLATSIPQSLLNWPHKFTQKLTLTKVSTLAGLLGLKTGSIYASYYYCVCCSWSCCCCGLRFWYCA